MAIICAIALALHGTSSTACSASPLLFSQRVFFCMLSRAGSWQGLAFTLIYSAVALFFALSILRIFF